MPEGHAKAGGAPIESDYPPPFERAWLGPRFWPTWLGLGLLWLLGLLPGALRRGLGGLLGDAAYRRHGKRRQIVYTNLAWCFPEKDEAEREALARRYFRLFSQSLLDYGIILWGGRRRLKHLLHLEGGEHLGKQVKDGRPVILLTCHNLGLDFGAAALTQSFRSVGLVKEARDPLLDWVVARGRTRFHGILYQRDRGIRPVVRAIKQGYAFYYLPDEDLGPEASVFVPFFGVPTATLTALSKLVRMTGAAVLPYMTFYRPEAGRYVAQIFPPLEGFPSGDQQADAARMNLELEKMIRLAPEQYMWSLRIFQSRPDGSPPPYAMKGKPGSGHRPRPEG